MLMHRRTALIQQQFTRTLRVSRTKTFLSIRIELAGFQNYLLAFGKNYPRISLHLTTGAIRVRFKIFLETLKARISVICSFEDYDKHNAETFRRRIYGKITKKLRSLRLKYGLVEDVLKL